MHTAFRLLLLALAIHSAPFLNAQSPFLRVSTWIRTEILAPRYYAVVSSSTTYPPEWNYSYPQYPFARGVELRPPGFGSLREIRSTSSVCYVRAPQQSEPLASYDLGLAAFPHPREYSRGRRPAETFRPSDSDARLGAPAEARGERNCSLLTLFLRRMQDRAPKTP